ncbi:hypothetical protein CAPTEDRAFT_189950, partial [Capitella teleta]
THNDVLAEQANLWAEECNFEHGFPDMDDLPYGKNVGQNIWVGTSSSEVIHNSIAAWFNEKDDYDFQSNTCAEGKMCGHYTQVVWSESHLVGCALKFCPTVDNLSFDNAYMFVCNYSPAGNLIGSWPYVKGEQCSNCPGYIGDCNDGLCHECSKYGGSCACNLTCENCAVKREEICQCACTSGWGGQSCHVTCENYHKNCDNGWYADKCGEWYVRSFCPATCGLCEIGDKSGEVCATNMLQDDPQ